MPELFHIPRPSMYGKVITSMWKKAEDTSAAPEVKDFLLLAHDLLLLKGSCFGHHQRNTRGGECEGLLNKLVGFIL